MKDINFDVDLDNHSLKAKVITTILCNNEEERYLTKKPQKSIFNLKIISYYFILLF